MKVEVKTWQNTDWCHPVIYIRGKENPKKDYAVIAVNINGSDARHNKIWDIFSIGHIGGCTYLRGRQNAFAYNDDASFIDLFIKIKKEFEREFNLKNIEYYIDPVWKEYEWDEILDDPNKFKPYNYGYRLVKYKEK